MSTKSKFDPIAEAWLAEGPTQLADRVLDAALAEVHLTRQRRRLPAPWRFRTMALPTRLAAAALVGILAVGVIYLNLPRRNDVGSPSPTPSLAPSPIPTTTASAAAGLTDEAWPGTTRVEPPGSGFVVPWGGTEGARLAFADTIGELGPAAPTWIDLSTIEAMQGYESGGASERALWFRLVDPRPAGSSADPIGPVAAYGVVLDVNGDGIPDYRIGMDNVVNVEGRRHREWISDLQTGEARVNPGPGYGWSAFGLGAETWFPGHEELADRGRLITSLGGPETRFYVWASVMEDGEAVTDYAPDSGWLMYDPPATDP